MQSLKTLALSAVGMAALVGSAAPASAQYYPGYGNAQYGYPTNVVGQILHTIVNPYGQFGYRGVNPRVAVDQCTAAVQQRLQMRYRARYGYGYGYSPYGYGNAYSNARILGITRVEQRSGTTMRVRGLATSGMSYGYGSPYGYGYGYGYGTYGPPSLADLSFRCEVDYRGYIRDIDIDRRH